MIALWLVLIASVSFGVYKNFTAIDMHTVHEKEVIEQRIVDTNRIENFVKGFAKSYFSWSNTQESIDKRTAATAEEVTEFLETFFKLYPTATEKELAYYVSGNALSPVNCDYVFSELVNPIFTKDGEQVKVSVSVKYLDQRTKATQISQFDLTLEKDSNWKIVG